VILKNPNKRTKPVMGKIIKAIKDLPHQARRSITFDRGSEFMNWPHLQAEIGTQTWSKFSLAEGNSRKHQSTRQALVATKAGYPFNDRSGHERDLRPPQQHAPQMPRMENASRSLPRKDDGGNAMIALL
jgi:hypothetical protein